ncbi:MAG: hypothetical protein ACLR7Z_12415 [Bilophila wadsworthia]
MRERFGIVLGGSEFAVEPEKITDRRMGKCPADRPVRPPPGQAGRKGRGTGRLSPRREACCGCRIGLRTGTPYPPGGRRTPYGQPGGARPVV